MPKDRHDVPAKSQANGLAAIYPKELVGASTTNLPKAVSYKWLIVNQTNKYIYTYIYIDVYICMYVNISNVAPAVPQSLQPTC